MKITTASSVASLSYCTVESAQDSHFHVLGWAFANFTLTLLMPYSMAWICGRFPAILIRIYGTSSPLQQ